MSWTLRFAEPAEHGGPVEFARTATLQALNAALSAFSTPIAKKRIGGAGSLRGTDQKLIASTLRKSGEIIAEYLEPGARDADATIAKLIATLDTQDLARALERLEHADGNPAPG